MVGPPPTATCPGQVRGAQGKGSTAPCRPAAGRTATRCRLETRAHREKRAPSKRGSQGACTQHSGRLSPAARCREPPPGANRLLNASLADIMRGTEGFTADCKGAGSNVSQPWRSSGPGKTDCNAGRVEHDINDDMGGTRYRRDA